MTQEETEIIISTKAQLFADSRAVKGSPKWADFYHAYQIGYCDGGQSTIDNTQPIIEGLRDELFNLKMQIDNLS